MASKSEHDMVMIEKLVAALRASPVLKKLELRIGFRALAFQALLEKLTTLEALQQVKLLDPRNLEVDGFLCFTTNCTKPPLVPLLNDLPFREWQTNDVPNGLHNWITCIHAHAWRPHS
jgi:hypothetical protein